MRIVSNSNLQQGNPNLKPAITYNANLQYSYRNALFLNLAYSYSLDDFTSSLSATLYNSLSLSKSFSLLFLFNYRGKSVNRTITNQPFAYLTMSVKQQFLNKRASAQLNFTDVFNSYINYYQQNSRVVQQLWRNRFDTSTIKLNLIYNFGGSIKNAKKSTGAEEEKKRSTLSDN